MKKKSIVTEEEIQQALDKFKKRGGLIKKLPAEVTPRNTLVGAKWGMYEPILDTFTGSDTWL